MEHKRRLIDADALIANLEKIAKEDETNFFHLDEVTQEIFDAPTVDAEEVIRCKDCIHAEPLPTNCELSASHYMCCGLWRGKETLNILHKQERNFLGHVFEENYYKDYSLVKCDGYCDSGARMDGDGDG